MVHWVSSNNIQAKELELYLSSELKKHGDFLYLTATQNIKKMRSDSTFITDLFTDNPNEKKQNLFTSIEFVQSLSKNIYAEGAFLSNADQKYILSKVIDYYYRDNDVRRNAMLNMRFALYELFELLLFHGKQIPDATIELISKNYSLIEKDIFKIYHTFTLVIDEVMQGKQGQMTQEILGKGFLKQAKRIKSTFLDKQKEVIESCIGQSNALFFDGFLFLNEIQKFILSTAIRQNKPVYLISKQFSDHTGDFIFEQSIEPIVSILTDDIERIHFEDALSNSSSALGCVKQKFPLTTSDSIKTENLLNDGSIRFIRPFIDREEELRYVAASISERLKAAYNGDINDLIRIVNDNIAIVIGIDKENYEERISNIFRDIGLFIFDKQRIEKTEFADVDTKTLEAAYFNKSDIINSDIKWNSGTELSFQDKLRFFEVAFHWIDINKYNRPIASYPVGQFILEIYRIITDGMSIEGFKNILYSNWRYVVDDKTSEKWSDNISAFRYIEIYLENKKSIEGWITTLKELVELQPLVTSNPLYDYHPLNGIKSESLHSILMLLLHLEDIIKQIMAVSGGIDSHLNTLKSVVMKADTLSSLSDDDLEFEQTVLKRLTKAVNEIGRSSLIENLDANYFAQNIRTMLTEWEKQNDLDTVNLLRLNVVNLENMKQYKHSYFVMCEANKYPRRYKESFPYTPEILDILENNEFGIGLKTQNIKGLDYHLQLERYLFKNVLDFTTESLTFTYCEKEHDIHNTPSVFVEDIASCFGSDIPFIDDEIGHPTIYSFEDNCSELYLPKKQEYTLTELAIFKLCPRLYYHLSMDENKGTYLSRIQLKFYFEAVLYCDLFKRFMNYNLENEKVYAKGTKEYQYIITALWKNCCDDNSRFFSFLSQYEIQDTIRNVTGKIHGFIDNSMQYLKGNQYTVISYQNKQYEGAGYTLTVEHDNRVVDYDKKTWRMSQNSTYLEFLVLKTSDGKSELTHYADMIKALDENAPDEDRVNLISRIIAKINIQFDSKRFASDGIKRTNDLVDEITQYDFSCAKAMESNYCNYCRFNNTCMEV